MKMNAVIILSVALLLSFFIPQALYAKITLDTGVIMVISMLIKDIRKEKKEKEKEKRRTKKNA